jgi:hypothetical protein
VFAVRHVVVGEDTGVGFDVAGQPRGLDGQAERGRTRGKTGRGHADRHFAGVRWLLDPAGRTGTGEHDRRQDPDRPRQRSKRPCRRCD